MPDVGARELVGLSGVPCVFFKRPISRHARPLRPQRSQLMVNVRAAVQRPVWACRTSPTSVFPETVGLFRSAGARRTRLADDVAADATPAARTAVKTA